MKSTVVGCTIATSVAQRKLWGVTEPEHLFWRAGSLAFAHRSNLRPHPCMLPDSYHSCDDVLFTEIVIFTCQSILRLTDF
jgi:hypothetical protein